jgi:putative ABC transport system substrate-binding protein
VAWGFNWNQLGGRRDDVLIRLLGSIAAAVCLFASAPTSAQTASKVPRIGVLWQTMPPPPIHPHVESLLKGLRDLGWEDGRTVAIEYRYGGNDAARLAEMASELVRLKVDVITTAGDLSTRAAQQATTSIPIVALVGFPVESGFVKSLARPGGNITGFAVIADELAVKRLELLKDLLPRLSRVAVLWDPVTHERQPRLVEAAARDRGLKVQILAAKTASELDGAFEAAVAARAEAMLVLISPMFIGNRSVLVRLASQHRLPTMYHHPTFTEAGGLIAYGPSLEEQWRQIAGTVDKVLRGARAAELPVQQPTRFELEVNLKAAREIGIDIPQSIRMRADRVIE